jgi:hypothetical protein
VSRYISGGPGFIPTLGRRFQHLEPATRVQFREGASNWVDTPFLQATTLEHERRTPNAKAPSEGWANLLVSLQFCLHQERLIRTEHGHIKVQRSPFIPKKRRSHKRSVQLRELLGGGQGHRHTPWSPWILRFPKLNLSRVLVEISEQPAMNPLIPQNRSFPDWRCNHLGGSGAVWGPTVFRVVAGYIIFPSVRVEDVLLNDSTQLCISKPAAWCPDSVDVPGKFIAASVLVSKR